jgi:hypothetical protein
MRKKLFVILALLIVVATIASAIVAAPADLSVPWWTVDAGGGTSTGGQFALSGTAGQADAGSMSGSAYTLSGGFWNPASGAIGGNTYRTYLPMTVR